MLLPSCWPFCGEREALMCRGNSGHAFLVEVSSRSLLHPGQSAQCPHSAHRHHGHHVQVDPSRALAHVGTVDTSRLQTSFIFSDWKFVLINSTSALGSRFSLSVSGTLLTRSEVSCMISYKCHKADSNVFLWLAYFTLCTVLQVHLCCSQISFVFQAEWYPLYGPTAVCVFICLSVDKLGGFCLWGVANNPAIKEDAQISLWDPAFNSFAGPEVELLVCVDLHF